MSQADLDLVQNAFSFVLGEDIDMREVILSPQLSGPLEAALAPDAVIEFATPDGGFVGDMAGPFRGPEGMRAGWAEWLAPWETFLFRGDDLIDVGGGRVLLLGDTMARMRSGIEVQAHVAAVYTIRDGQIVAIEHFLDQDQARRAVGLA